MSPPTYAPGWMAPPGQCINIEPPSALDRRLVRLVVRYQTICRILASCRSPILGIISTTKTTDTMAGTLLRKWLALESWSAACNWASVHRGHLSPCPGGDLLSTIY